MKIVYKTTYGSDTLVSPDLTKKELERNLRFLKSRDKVYTIIEVK